MDFVKLYSKEIIALLAPVIAWLVDLALRPRAKLIRGTKHAFTFLVQQPIRDAEGNIVRPTQNVLTASIAIRNTGREAATNVEVVFNWKPMCINLAPSRHYEEKIAPDNRYTLALGSLAPKEFLGIELLAVNQDLPDLITVRSDQSVAVEEPMAPQVLIPRWMFLLRVWLILTGLAANVYCIAWLIQWLGTR
jgi:hypothetical protein